MCFLVCFALKKRFSGSLVVVRRATVVFIVVFAGPLQNPTVRRGMGIILAALAAEITGTLVATKFCAALEFRELVFFVNFAVVVVVLPLFVYLFIPLDGFTLQN